MLTHHSILEGTAAGRYFRSEGRKEGRLEGRKEGRLEGRKEGRLEGEIRGQLIQLEKMLRDGIIGSAYFDAESSVLKQQLEQLKIRQKDETGTKGRARKRD